MKFPYFIICCLLATGLMAQTNVKKNLSPEEEAKIYEELSKLSPEEYSKRFWAQHKRVPDFMKNRPSSIPSEENAAPFVIKKKSAEAIRPNIRFPAEFEELQGVFISWPYNSGVIDILSNSAMANIYVKLADAIQKNAKVYINVDKAADTSKVLTLMNNKGTPLTNYQFLVNTTDAFWARDYGPVNYYYGAQDSIGWLDFKYYDGRDSDNLLPQKWGKALNIPVYTTPIAYEGGNILQDGRGRLATSSMVLDINLFDYAISNQRVKDSLNYLLNLKTRNIIQYLPHDGGTGHIDLYVDMADENTYVYAQFPQEMASIPAFSDYTIAAKNIDTLRAYGNHDGFPMRFRKVTLPPKDDGSWYANGNEYNTYTRTYVNHLIVNKAIIQPIFHDDIDGFKPADDELINLLKTAYPGYIIYPIDMREFDGSGGSIHCITKEFHAENPLTIWHYAYDSIEPYQSNYAIDATIHNRSGIAQAFVYYRLKGSTNWTKAPLTNTSGESFSGNIPAPNQTGATFEYYIEAKSNNGKTMTKPMTAPGGFYTFKYGTGSSSLKDIEAMGVSHFYPNPVKGSTYLDLNFASSTAIKIDIMNQTGQVFKSVSYADVVGKNTLQINTEDLPTGFYLANVYLNGNLISTSKLIK